MEDNKDDSNLEIETTQEETIEDSKSSFKAIMPYYFNDKMDPKIEEFNQIMD